MKFNFFFFLKKTPNFLFFLLSQKQILNFSNSIHKLWYLKRELSYLEFLLLKNASFLNYNFLSDLTASHYPTQWFALEIHYILRNLKRNQTLILSKNLCNPFHVGSACFIYQSADWLEREAFDMFGIWFFNHSNLRRILTDYGFKGFPLRKEFPVYGFKELRYDIEKQQLIYTPVFLTQKWRNYLFLRQWNN